MTEPTEEKTRRLLLAIELIAIGVAAILILIDYKLKRDLLELFARIETAIETGNRLYGTNTDNSARDSTVYDGTVVGDNPTMETANVPSESNGHPQNGKTANRNASSVRNRGTRNQTIPEPDKPVGP